MPGKGPRPPPPPPSPRPLPAPPPLGWPPPPPCLRQQPLREVEPLGQLAHLRLEPQQAVFQVRDAALPGRSIRLVPRLVPADEPSPVAVLEVTGCDHHYVVQIPDAEAAEREAHPDTALHATGIEAVQPERSAHHREAQRHGAGALRHGTSPLVGLRRRVARHGVRPHGQERSARASSSWRGIAPARRATSPPRRNTMSVGMARMSKRRVVAGLRSVSSFTTSTSPWRWRAKSSRTGAMIL